MHESEDADLLCDCATFAERFNQVREQLEANRKPYVFNERIDWESIGKEVDLLHGSDIDIEMPGDLRMLSEDQTGHDLYDVGHDLGLKRTSPASGAFTSVQKAVMPDDEFRALARHLVWDQKRYLCHVLHHFKYSPEKKFREFLTGGAGTRKSVTVECVGEGLTRLMSTRPGCNSDSVKVLIVARRLLGTLRSMSVALRSIPRFDGAVLYSPLTL